ncbi:putative exopolysaccharide biosynthesis protein (protein-tyrosine kinase) [Thermodesulfatator indicus DSM 15286]|uniref:Exopolysaccharide biosynthesis protein (Protein-tyrosine kinase) n=1 Tax=Thermodesulfatator indicus (strain DSM 15286 / JCM 11887 / CIR29812) TaxID=667014 RepID=F8A8K2_THEID|nr:CpsD/CapB family tyrosine-protein kinase [Thermodesulfatator indicus]AEH45088.1 putative exopolysaccharide biosynthesis protein (protein-tyrosine kinase) [Thermodesulfatator indicus DSM 15286]
MGKISKLVDSIEKETLEEDKIPFTAPLSPEEDRILKNEEFPQITLTDVDPRLLVYHQPDSLVAEHFKILRSQILHPRTGLPARFILVTSAVPKEGKTYTAVSLAFSFARTTPTLLIEADLRKPSFSEKLGIKLDYGLSDYLAGERRELNSVVYKTDYHNLYILPAGKTRVEAKDLFSSESIIHFLEELRTKFPKHFFIFDSPPVLVASESISLSRLADGILFVVRYAFSDYEVVAEAVDKIGKSKLLGFVFNNYMPSSLGLFSPKLKYYRYAYKYKYYK